MLNFKNPITTFTETTTNASVYFYSINEGAYTYEYAPSYENIVAYFLVANLVAGLLCWLPTALAPVKPVLDKNSAYECGFEPFFTTNDTHEIHFVIISVLFVIFDLEIVLLTPPSMSPTSDGYDSYLTTLTFAAILIAGLVYEWFTGVLNWPVFVWTTEAEPVSGHGRDGE